MTHTDNGNIPEETVYLRGSTPCNLVDFSPFHLLASEFHPFSILPCSYVHISIKSIYTQMCLD